MAGSLVSGALEKITRVTGQQFELFACATNELKTIKRSFQSIEALLRDAESRQVAEQSVHVWLSNLKHVAYDIDDVLDEGEILGLGEEGDDGGDFINKVIQYLLSPCNCFDYVVSRFKVAYRVKEIRKRLDQIDDDKNKYNFSSSSVGGDERRTSSLKDESEKMIGRESDKEILVSRLVSGSSHEGDGGQVHVVAVVGIGGQGKTTLAQQIYHDEQVRAHFNTFLWVCVSDVFDVIRLTKAIIEQAKEESASLSELDSLQKMLLRELRGKRFFLVLDDVWNDDEEKWKMLLRPLNSDAQGSRILVTTRSDKVANTMKATYIHELKGLSDDQSWTLFSSRAFVGRNEGERSKLESVGREIVKKCKGVPISIRVIASAMNTKSTVEAWESTLNSRTWSLRQVQSEILPALLLTYYNLPTHLKQCFVYCSTFPKDWWFGKDTLVRLWVAQGLIRWEESREIDDVGAEYFEELVARSILQRTEGYGETGYTVHDQLHDLGEFIARDEIYRFNSTGEGGKSDVRHAFVSFTGAGDSSNNVLIALRESKKLRTLFLKGFDDGNHEVILAALFKQSRFLRAVGFENSRIKMLPYDIGKMKHLRYLDLSGSYIVELPESVSHLRNLHTLNLNDCHKLKKLPRGIGGMVSLRHLEIEGTDALEYLPKGLGRISGLRSLSKFIVGGGGEKGCRIDELQRLNSLHGSLKIEHLQRVSSGEEAEKAQLGNKPYLRRLVLWTSAERDGDDAETERMDNVLEGLRPHVNLEELELYKYRGSRLPSWMAVMRSLRKLSCQSLGSLPDSLESLQQLEIRECEKLESLPDSLGQLKSLRHLKISSRRKLESLPDSFGQLKAINYSWISDCDALRSLPDSFGQLKVLDNLVISECNALRSLPDSLGQLESLKNLRISYCPKLESLPHSIGQLKALNHLEISHCYALRSLPDGLQHLSLLQQLTINACPLLWERCTRDVGEDWPKISHIPHIIPSIATDAAKRRSALLIADAALKCINALNQQSAS